MKPLVETIRFKSPPGWACQKLDMASRGPKTFPRTVPTWSSEHSEVAKDFWDAKEAARKRYGKDEAI